MGVVLCTSAGMLLVVGLSVTVLTYTAFAGRHRDVPRGLRWTSPLIRFAERARSHTLVAEPADQPATPGRGARGAR